MFQLDARNLDERLLRRVSRSRDEHEWLNAKTLKLAELLHRLPEKQRDAIINVGGLFGREPKSQADLAREEGVSRAAICKRVHSAIATLTAIADSN